MVLGSKHEAQGPSTFTKTCFGKSHNKCNVKPSSNSQSISDSTRQPIRGIFLRLDKNSHRLCNTLDIRMGVERVRQFPYLACCIIHMSWLWHVTDLLSALGIWGSSGGHSTVFQVGVCGPDFRSVGLANWYCFWKGELVNWKFPNFGACELNISKF